MRVTLNREKIKSIIRSHILSKLKEREGEFTHTNHDPLYTPARWWYDLYNTALGGYILNTTGILDVREVNNKIVLEVVLFYTKTPR